MREVAGPPGAPTLVLLHGWTATGALNWFSSFDALGRRFHVVCPDQRGHGRGIRSRPFTLEACADDAVALADALSSGPVIPVGYSLGGPVAQLMWRRHPGRVAGLVLCATSARFGRDGDRPAAANDARAVALQLTPAALRRRAPLGAPPRHDPVAIAEAGGALRRFDSRGWIGDVDVPTAVVLTTRDRLVPPALQADLARTSRATIHPVDGGHDVVVAAPERFVPALLDACDTVARRAQTGGHHEGR